MISSAHLLSTAGSWSWSTWEIILITFSREEELLDMAGGEALEQVKTRAARRQARKQVFAGQRSGRDCRFHGRLR